MRWRGRLLRREDGGQPDQAQRNFTNLDSRVLPARRVRAGLQRSDCSRRRVSGDRRTPLRDQLG